MTSRAAQFVFANLLLFFSACAMMIPSQPAPGKLTLTQVNFNELPGWDQDHQSEALETFERSCTMLAQKPADLPIGPISKASDWQKPCGMIDKLEIRDEAAARAFFELYFTAYRAEGDGLFTGYYEPELRGALTEGGVYLTPLYTRPADLVTADLGEFKPEWEGQHIAGKIELDEQKTQLVPYDDRAAIDHNALAGRADVLVWVDDPVDAFFLEVQGSGRIRLLDGSIMRVGYDGANGRAYTAIGRVLAAMDEIQKPVTMPAIRAWLKAHPDRAQEIMDLNPSYVFFRKLGNEGPIGAEGVVLTPLRSLAVDPDYVPLGAPLWLDTQDANGLPLRRLVIAQDTGGAVKGPVRGDFFWGAGKDAEDEAGSMQSAGHYYLLLPKSVKVDAQ